MTGSKLRFSQQQVIDAILKTHGLKGPAAAVLHCDRRTISRYVERYPAIKEAYDEALQASLDVAQARMMDLVQEKDWRAIRFMLSTLGKDRGFTERQEIVAVGETTESLRQQILQDLTRIYGDDEEEGNDDE